MRVLPGAPLRARGSGPRAAGRPRGPAPPRRPMPWWWTATSASWPPIRRVGLNEVIGSWNTMASEVPSSCRCACVSAGAQVGAEQLEPGGVDAAGVVDQPARRRARSATCRSPTRPRRRPPRRGVRRSETPRTGRIGPAGPGKVTSRSRTSSTRSVAGVVRSPASGLAALERGRRRRQRGDPADHADAEALGDGLAEQVEREAGDEHGDAGRERGGRVDVDRADAVEEQPAPVVRGLLHAEAEERQAGEGRAARRRRRWWR